VPPFSLSREINKRAAAIPSMSSTQLVPRIHASKGPWMKHQSWCLVSGEAVHAIIGRDGLYGVCVVPFSCNIPNFSQVHEISVLLPGDQPLDGTVCSHQ
jgi:hypothetical protein